MLKIDIWKKNFVVKIINEFSSAVFCGNFENFSKKKLVDVGVSWNLTFSRSHEQRIKMNSKAESRLLRRDTYPKIIPFIPFLILPSLQETVHYPFTLKITYTATKELIIDCQTNLWSLVKKSKKIMKSQVSNFQIFLKDLNNQWLT